MHKNYLRHCKSLIAIPSEEVKRHSEEYEPNEVFEANDVSTNRTHITIYIYSTCTYLQTMSCVYLPLLQNQGNLLDKSRTSHH